MEEYERFTRMAAMWGCFNEDDGKTCRDEYTDAEDEWCLPCIAVSIVAEADRAAPPDTKATTQANRSTNEE